MLAALACAVELALAGALPLQRVVPAMLGVHALIGVGEALITCAALALLERPAQIGAVTDSRRFAAPALAALLIVLCLSPFASPLPDGLEAVLAQYQVLHEAAPLFVTPLADRSHCGADLALESFRQRPQASGLIFGISTGRRDGHAHTRGGRGHASRTSADAVRHDRDGPLSLLS